MDLARPGKYLSFQLGDLSYGMPIGIVREINRMMPITPIPETPEFVAGVINLRGQVIPVLDVKKRFALPATAVSRQTCIVVVESGDGLCGLLVDSILGVITLSPDQIEPRPLINPTESTCVNGMGKSGDRILVLIDVTLIVSGEWKRKTNAA